MFLFELGEVVERTELFDTIEEVKHQHLRHAAEVAFRLFQEEPFDHLVIGAPPEVAAELAARLHPYLRGRLVERLSLSVQATDEQLRRAALDVERTVERKKEQALVRKLRDAVGSGRRGVGGLDPTLRALVERRVEHLLVSAGLSRPRVALPSLRLSSRRSGGGVRCATSRWTRPPTSSSTRLNRR